MEPFVISIVLGYALAGAAFRLCWGGLLPKWAAWVIGALLAVALPAASWWFGLAPWDRSAVVGVAALAQWSTPGRDFSSSRSLLEAHGPWACVASAAAWSPIPLAGAIMVVAGYFAFQRWWPDRPHAFWRPTVCAEAWAGAWVWPSAAAGVLL